MQKISLHAAASKCITQNVKAKKILRKFGGLKKSSDLIT